MSSFIHHPDGRIYIDEMKISLEAFLESEPGYKLPDDAIGMRYNGARSVYYSKTRERVEDGADLVLEGYIKKKAEYKAKEKAKDEANKPTEKEWLDEQVALDQAMIETVYDLETRLSKIEDPTGTPMTIDEFKLKLFRDGLARAKGAGKIKAGAIV